MFINEYELIEKLDENNFSQTFKVSKKGDKGYFIIDKLKKRDNDIPKLEKILKESISTIKDINHPNIIKMIDFKEDSDYYYCIYDYCNGGNLSDYIKYLKENNKSFSEEEAQYIMKQLIEAFKYFHNKGIIHNDIKTSNILIYYDSEEDLLKKNILKAKIKLTGFYSSCNNEKEKKIFNNNEVIKKYMPKQIKNEKDYKEKLDLWSLGLVFCELLSCEINFEPENMVVQIPYFQNISKEANSFINCILQFEPENKKNADELSKHEFLTKNVKDFSC